MHFNPFFTNKFGMGLMPNMMPPMANQYGLYGSPNSFYPSNSSKSSNGFKMRGDPR
jgi:hypothetical protein